MTLKPYRCCVQAGGVEAVVACMRAYPLVPEVQLAALLCLVPASLENPMAQVSPSCCTFALFLGLVLAGHLPRHAITCSPCLALHIGLPPHTFLELPPFGNSLRNCLHGRPLPCAGQCVL